PRHSQRGYSAISVAPVLQRPRRSQRGYPAFPTTQAFPHGPGVPHGPDVLSAGRPRPSARATRSPAHRLAEPFAVMRHVDLTLRRRAVALGQSAHGGLHPSSYTGRMQTTVRVSKENRDSLARIAE